jgi:hypothetical protein
MDTDLAAVIVSIAAVVVGIASVVIARGALKVAVDQATQAREHARISISPHLSIRDENEYEGDYSDHRTVRLINTGVGPAVISGFRVRVEDDEMAGSWGGWEAAIHKLSEMGIPLEVGSPRMYYLSVGDWVAPNEDLRLLDVTIKPETIQSMKADLKTSKSEAELKRWAATELEKQVRKLTIEIDYTSAYGERQRATWP